MQMKSLGVIKERFFFCFFALEINRFEENISEL